MEKANITLYTVIGNPDRIVTSIRDRFKEMTKELTSENGAIILTLADDSNITFNTAINRINRTLSHRIQPAWPTISLPPRHHWSN